MSIRETSVIAILDVGKTNKKLLVFDQDYQLLQEDIAQPPLTVDDEGDPCEDLDALSDWVRSSVVRVVSEYGDRLKAINFAGYGASFVHVDQAGVPVFPLYDYLKPFPEDWQKELHLAYGGQQAFCRATASPALGNLNSGLQLLRLQKKNRDRLARVQYSLHLPQYLASVVTGQAVSDITSIGCHTALWDFDQRQYHRWTSDLGLDRTLAPLIPTTHVTHVNLHGKVVQVGVGIHDSSAALIPYLSSMTQPFVLLSTGTWSISLNPFNATPLTAEELDQDCLCYLDFKGRPVKAARWFAGHVHDESVKQWAEEFHVRPEASHTISFNPDWSSPATAADASQAYHKLVAAMIERQVASTRLVIEQQQVSGKLFVDGGFGRNEVYMHLLADAFPDWEVASASVPQATALGAALAVREHWNPGPLPEELIRLEHYSSRA